MPYFRSRPQGSSRESRRRRSQSAAPRRLDGRQRQSPSADEDPEEEEDDEDAEDAVDVVDADDADDAAEDSDDVGLEHARGDAKDGAAAMEVSAPAPTAAAAAAPGGSTAHPRVGWAPP